MKPDDLVEFGRQTYVRSNIVTMSASDISQSHGLSPEELAFLEQLPATGGTRRVLLLSVGGGRESWFSSSPCAQTITSGMTW